MSDQVIRGGNIVNADGLLQADIAIAGTRIGALRPICPAPLPRSTRAVCSFFPASSTSTFTSTSRDARNGKAPLQAAARLPPAAAHCSSICR